MRRRRRNPFGPNTVGAAQRPGSRLSKVSKNFIPSEYPPGWKDWMTPDDFERLSIRDAERQGDTSAVTKIRDRIAPLLDTLTPKR